MTQDQIIVFCILAMALVLFAWGKYRHDIVALITLIAIVASGLIKPADAFVGFGHPAVITVAAVLIISHALKLSGVVDMLASKLTPYTKNQTMHIISLTGVVTVASAFMNNVGALALMLPVALATAAEQNRSPAILLMPLAFGSILGGMTTMIGTPPNIIIAQYRADTAGEPFQMFDFTGVGFPVAVIGVLFVAFIGWRLIPKERLNRNAAAQLFEISEYLVEVKVTADSICVGEAIDRIEALNAEDVQVLGYARGSGRARPISPHHELETDDVLMLRADPASLQPILDDLKLELVTSKDDTVGHMNSGELEMIEGVVQHDSLLEGRGLAYLHRLTGHTVTLVAMARQSSEPMRRRLRRQVFQAGDILLLEGHREALDASLSTLSLIPLASREVDIGKEKRVWFALAIFGAAIAIGVIGWFPLTVTFIAAVVVYVVVGILPVRELYDNVDWPVIVLLGAMIPVGGALESTGATTLVANSIVSLTDGLAPWIVLALVLVVTMFLSDVINNAATALVMAPIAVGIAAQLGVNSDSFLMAVAVGASCAFLTPIGHQSNTLVMGPGGYAFTDYWRMGLPLEVVITVIGVAMILVFWPLAG